MKSSLFSKGPLAGAASAGALGVGKRTPAGLPAGASVFLGQGGGPPRTSGRQGRGEASPCSGAGCLGSSTVGKASASL